MNHVRRKKFSLTLHVPLLNLERLHTLPHELTRGLLLQLIKDFISLYFSLSAQVLGDTGTSHDPMLMVELESPLVSDPVLPTAQPSCRVTSPSEIQSQVNAKGLFCDSSEGAH